MANIHKENAQPRLGVFLFLRHSDRSAQGAEWRNLAFFFNPEQKVVRLRAQNGRFAHRDASTVPISAYRFYPATDRRLNADG